MPLFLQPFFRLLHPPSGSVLSQLPTTRTGLGRVPGGQLVPAGRVGFTELRITSNVTGRSSRGICGLLPARAFADGRVLPHEQTLLPRLRTQEEMVRRDTGGLGKPVLLTVPTLKDWWARTEERYRAGALTTTFAGTNNRYDLRFLDPRAATVTQALSLSGMGPVCIADGHHRAATHALLAERGLGYCREVPVCLIGADELTIGVFARLIDVARPVEELLVALGPFFTVTETEVPRAPGGVGEWLLARGGRYFHLQRKLSEPHLDAAYLDEVVLPAVFSISDPRADGRLSFEPVPTAPARPVNYSFPQHGNVLIGHPLPTASFFAETAAGRLLPPKSTRFEPRVPSGLIVWPGCEE